jgi:hypothetical protein
MDANTEILQATAQANFGRDLNGALRIASGLKRDANGQARALTGKDLNASFTELLDLLTPP